MPLDTRMAAFLADRPAASALPPLAEIRKASDLELASLQGPPEAVTDITTLVTTTADGYPLRVRIYRPATLDEPSAPAPAIVFAHGGGWFQCSLALYDNPCRALANATRCVVLSVDYRLAPEHPFPQPLEDVYHALVWAAGHAGALGIDPHRLAVGGDSAGGNLAAGTALLARDRGGPAIAHQLLLYPALDHAMNTDSYTRHAGGYYLTRDIMQFCWSVYLESAADGASPYASPLQAPDLAGLPAATILVCEYDPLRDEGIDYARRLREAGVEARAEQLDGMIHACIHMSGLTPAARRLFERAGSLVVQALA